MRVFLAGATGVIGRALIPQLRAAGHDLVAMTRSEDRAERLSAQGLEAVVCDALDDDRLKTVVAESRPEAVIHELTDIPPRMNTRRMASELAGTNRLRREGTRNLIAAAQAAGAGRLLAQSVAFAYAPVGDRIKDEQAPLALDVRGPMREVVGALGSLEDQVLGAGGIVLRYGFFYGPGTQLAADGFYGELAQKRQLPVVGSGAGLWSFIHVADAAAATVAALERGSSGVYNVVDDHPAPAAEWIPLFASAIGAKRPRHAPAWPARLLAGQFVVAGMTTQRGASNRKAKDELNWSPSHPSWCDELARAAG